MNLYKDLISQENKPLIEMATVGYTNDNYCIIIYTNDSGNIPHFHYCDMETRGKKFHTCIRLGKAEYFHHGFKQDILNSKQRKELVEFLQKDYSGSKKINISNWEYLLNLWNNENNSNVKVDEDMPMPDYRNLYNKSILHEDSSLIEMATVGYMNNYCLVVYTNDNGNIPHFHYIDSETRGKKFHTCIRLDKAEYFYHGSKQDILNSKQRKELVEFLNTKHHRYENETNWQHLLYLWNEENNSNVRIDENLPMPDYRNLFENITILNEDSNLYKGIFWIKDTDDISSSKLYFQIPCDSNGYITDSTDINFTSKSGNSFNHKNTWNTLTKRETDNKPFDYYPRGRVEISNGKAIIYVNPNIANDELKNWCIDKFNLTPHNGIKNVIIKPDNSNHYKCHLDDDI